jgi:hypothetical protein
MALSNAERQARWRDRNQIKLTDDAESIAWQLMHMDDQKKLLKVSRYIRDHLKLPDRTDLEKQIALGRAGVEDHDGRPLSKTAAIEQLRNPPPDHSYGVQVVADDRRLFGNGVRLVTQEQAQLYADIHVPKKFDNYVTINVVRFDSEVPVNSIIKRRNQYSLTFVDGTCGSLDWRPLPLRDGVAA